MKRSVNPHPVDLSLVPALKYRRQSYEKAKHSLPLCLVLRQMVSVIRYSMLGDIGLKPNCKMGLSIYIFMAEILLLLSDNTVGHPRHLKTGFVHF